MSRILGRVWRIFSHHKPVCCVQTMKSFARMVPISHEWTLEKFKCSVLSFLTRTPVSCYSDCFWSPRVGVPMIRSNQLIRMASIDFQGKTLNTCQPTEQFSWLGMSTLASVIIIVDDIVTVRLIQRDATTNHRIITTLSTSLMTYGSCFLFCIRSYTNCRAFSVDEIAI